MDREFASASSKEQEDAPKAGFKWRFARAVFRDDRLSAATKVVAAVITDHCMKHRHAWPGYTAIAREAGCSIATAKKSVKDLEAEGWFSVSRNFNGRRGEYGTNTYYPEWGRANDDTAVQDLDHRQSDFERGRIKSSPGQSKLRPNTSHLNLFATDSILKQESPFSERDEAGLEGDAVSSFGQRCLPVNDNERTSQLDGKCRPVPSDWQPSSRDISYMMRSTGFTRAQVDDEVRFFVDWFLNNHSGPVERPNWDAVWGGWSKTPKVHATGLIKDRDLNEAWDSFIAVFPNQFFINSGRKAFELVVTEGLTQTPVLIAAAEQYAKHVAGSRVEQPVSSGGWLRNKRWTDEYETEQRTTKLRRLTA